MISKLKYKKKLMCLLLMSNSDFKLTIYLRFFVHYHFLQIGVKTYYKSGIGTKFKTPTISRNHFQSSVPSKKFDNV